MDSIQIRTMVLAQRKFPYLFITQSSKHFSNQFLSFNLESFNKLCYVGLRWHLSKSNKCNEFNQILKVHHQTEKASKIFESLKGLHIFYDCRYQTYLSAVVLLPGNGVGSSSLEIDAHPRHLLRKTSMIDLH